MTRTNPELPRPIAGKIAAQTAIQPDFATLPRKAEPSERTNLAGLTRDRLRQALVEARASAR